MRTLRALVLCVSSLALTACSQSVGVAPGGGGGAGGAAGGGTGGTAATDVPWSKSFGTPDLQTSSRLGAVTADDSVLAATWDEPTTPHYDIGPRHLRRFDPLGNALSDEVIDNLHDVAVGSDGSLILAFSVDDGAPTSILGTPVSCAGGGTQCGCLARIGTDGTVAWVRTFEAQGDKAYVDFNDIRIAGNGRLVVSGSFGGTLDTGAGILDSDSPKNSLFITELMPDGTTVWSHPIRFFYTGDFGGWFVLDVAVSPVGDVVVGGLSDTPVDFGDGVQQPVTGHSGYFARYDAAGNVVHRGALTTANDWPLAVAVDTGGNTVLAAWVEGTFDLGGGVMGTAGKQELYLARLDPAGHFLGAKPIADGVGFAGLFLSVDPADHVWLCGGSGPLNSLSGVPVQPASEQDLLILKLDPTGNLVSQRQFGTTGWMVCGGMRVGPTGVPVVSGILNGSVDFGQGPLQTIGATDGFLAKLGPGSAP